VTFEHRSWSRRQLIRFGATAIVGVPAISLLTSCGGGDATSTGGPSDAESGGSYAALPPDAILAARWIPTELGPGSQRLPVSVGDAGGLSQEGPDRLLADVISLADDSVVVERLFADRRSLGEGTIPFWTFRTSLTEPGFYSLVVDGGPAEGVAFQIQDPADLVVNRAGDQLDAFDTPTVDDPRGVEVICTRQPEPCPFHDLTLTEALATGKPVVYLVGTPAHCQTGVCGPVLDQLIELAEEIGDSAVFVHADVYADIAATEPSPAVTAAKLTFEPVLFVTDAAGRIVERLDAVWDVDEVWALLS
jgi:hypothetical protein